MAAMRKIGILVVVAGAGAAGYLARGRIMGLVRGQVGGAAPAPATVPAPREGAPPQQSNYDARGPVANTATPIPAPDPHTREPIDEAAEEAAAAAEAAAIGGPAPEYPGFAVGEDADEADRALAEAGEGLSEGQELTEYDLAEAAEPTDTMSDAQRQIEETIEAQDAPYLGERPEPLASIGEPVAEAEQAARDAAEEARPAGDGDGAGDSSERPAGP
jgi:hypothetical protein